MAVDRSLQVRLAPQLDAVHHDVRAGRIDQAAREARGALSLAEEVAGRYSQAAGDALEVLIEARIAQGMPAGRESRRMLERLVWTRNADGPVLWERPRRPGEGEVVGRPPAADPPAPGPAPPTRPPVEPSGKRQQQDPLWVRIPRAEPAYVTPELCRALLHDFDARLRCMDVLVEAAVERGNMLRAEVYLREAADYRRGLSFEDDLDRAANLFVLGSIESRLGAYQAARGFLEEALALRERKLGNRPMVAATLHELANVHFAAGRYAEARRLYERALEIWGSHGSGSRLEVVAALDSLGLLLVTTGDYAEARRLLERAVTVAERGLGRRHPLVASALTSYGTLLHSIGEFDAARASFLRAIAILEKSVGRDDPGLAGPLNALASLALDTGDYARARARFERVLALLLWAVPETSPAFVTPLLGLARVARLTGEGDEVALLERALHIQESALGPSHPGVATLLIELAKARRKDLLLSRDALELASRAIAIRRRAFGGSHPLYAESLAELGDQWLWRGRPEMARPLFEEAAGTIEQALGPDHPTLAQVLVRVALARFLAREEQGALDAALRAERIGTVHLAWALGDLSEEDALRYSATRSLALDLALSLASLSSADAATAAAWDSVVRSRAAVLDEMATRRRGAGTSPQAVAASAALAQSTRHLAQLVVRASSEDDGFDRYQRLLADARERRDQKQRALAELVLPGRRGGTARRVGLAEAIAALPARSALVAFSRFNRFALPTDGSPAGAIDLSTTPAYLAFVWSEGSAGPRLVSLGSAQAIDTFVESWRREGARPLLGGRGDDTVEASYRAAAVSLRRRVWDPIEPLVRGASRVFLVPDGTLNFLNWAALPVAQAGYLVDGDPSFHYLSAERDLVGFAAPRHSGRGLLAVGEPAFDDGRLFSAWASAKGRSPGKRAAAPATRVAALRGDTPGCGRVREIQFAPLPASGREAAAVADLWNRRPIEDGATALRLTADAASETAVKKLAIGRRVLHLATHGFFLDAACAEPSFSGSRGVGGLVGADPAASSPGAPFRLAGLALAGANQRQWAGPKEEDGILTAEEIATLDLSGVEWAVLSACNTGVGTVRAGEGILGLRRAFEVAGAGTLLMSLWPVEDEAASRWMRSLYRARLEDGLATDDAVRAASREVLNERRGQGLDTHPHSWAAFVAAGDWR